MEESSVDYHLKQAVSHLKMALNQTQSELHNESLNESTVEENAQKWSEFLSFLMGTGQTTTRDELGEFGNDGAKY